jgi:hypothetical protein
VANNKRNRCVVLAVPAWPMRCLFSAVAGGI